VLLAQLLLDAIRAQLGDLSTDVDARLVDRVAQGLARVAANDQAAGLGHEPAQVTDRPANHDVDALHGDTAARRRVAVNDEQASAPGRAGGLACVSLHHDGAGGQVLGEAGTCVSMHPHGRQLVHPGAVVAHVPFDLDLDLGVDPAGDRVGTVGVHDAPATWPVRTVREVVEALVQLAERRGGEIDDLDRRRLRRLRHAHTFCRSHA
jgi:hypothetical protein